MIPGERSSSSRRKPDKKRPEPASTEDFKAAVAKLDRINAAAKSNNFSNTSYSQSNANSSRNNEGAFGHHTLIPLLNSAGMPSPSPGLSTPISANRTSNIASTLRTPSKRRRNVVLDSEDEETPEHALSEGLTLIDISASDRHQRKKRATAPELSSEDEHITDASPPLLAAQPQGYQANTQIQRADAQVQNGMYRSRMSPSSIPRCLRVNCQCGGHV